MSGIFTSLPLRWVVALIAFPIGGYIGLPDEAVSLAPA